MVTQERASGQCELLRVSFVSAEDLTITETWRAFLVQLEQILGGPLSHLDDCDPVRRKVDSIEDASAFICSFNANAESRRLHGKIVRSNAGKNIELDIALFKETNLFPCSADLYLPLRFLDEKENVKRLIQFFTHGNQILKTFYGYVDSVEQVIAKKKATRMAVNLEAELPGIFWLTYVNDQYVNYLGQEKLERLRRFGIETTCGGQLHRYGAMPGTAESIAARNAAQELLGREHFVDPALKYEKLPGRHALTMKQLRNVHGLD